MKRFLSKSLLGLTLLASSTIASCSCNRLVEEDTKADTSQKEEKKDEVLDNKTNTDENNPAKDEDNPGTDENDPGTNVEDDTPVNVEIDPDIYDINVDASAHLFGQLGQRKQLTPIIDGEALDPSLFTWTSDHSDYISVNEQGIVQANSDLEFVTAKHNEIVAGIQAKIQRGEINLGEMPEQERNYVLYQASTNSIITAVLKSDKSKYDVFKVNGDFNKFETKYAEEGKKDVVIHTVPYGEDSTVTFNLETENVGSYNTYSSDDINYENPTVVYVKKTHLIYIENHLNPIEDLLCDTTATNNTEDNPNPIEIFAHRGSEYGSYNSKIYSEGDIIKLIDCPEKRTFTIQVENALFHKENQVQKFERLGTTFTITVNIV